MTLFIGGPAHGREMEVFRAPVEIPVPRERVSMIDPDPWSRPKTVLYHRRKLYFVDEDGRLGWTREVMVSEELSDAGAALRLKELLFERFIKAGIQVRL